MPSWNPLDLDPNPVIEGEDVSVQYDASRTLHYSVDGGPWQELSLDAQGRGSLEAPAGATLIVFADLQESEENGVSEFVNVISQGS